MFCCCWAFAPPTPPEGIGGNRPPKPAGGWGIPPALVLSLRYPLCEGDPPYNPLISHSLTLSLSLTRTHLYFISSLSTFSSIPTAQSRKTKQNHQLYLIYNLSACSLPPFFKYNNGPYASRWCSVSFMSVCLMHNLSSLFCLINKREKFDVCELIPTQKKVCL